MHEPLDAAADIDKRAEVANASHDAVELLAHLKGFEHLGPRVGGLPLDHGPPGENQPAGSRHEFCDQAFERLTDQLLEIFHPPWAHGPGRHEAPEATHLALEAALVGAGHAGLDDHPDVELRPVFDGNRPVGRRHLIEAVFFIAATDADLDRLPDRGQFFAFLKQPHQFHRPLPAAAEIDEGGVGADRDHGAGDPLPRLQRLVDLGWCRFLQQLIDRDAIERRGEVGLEIIIEIGPQVGHGHPLRGLDHIGKGRLLLTATASLPPPAAAAARRFVASRCGGRAASRGGRCRGRLARRSGHHRRSHRGRRDVFHLRCERRRLHARPLRADRDPPRRGLLGGGFRLRNIGRWGLGHGGV